MDAPAYMALFLAFVITIALVLMTKDAKKHKKT